MGRPRKPIERVNNTAKGDGITPSKTVVPVTPVTGSVVPRNSFALPVPVSDLGERGLAEWEKVWTAGHWLDPDQDYHWVEQLAHSYDEIVTYRAAIGNELVVRGSLGQPVAHPLFAEIRKCQETIRLCLSKLGFSPTDRARLGIMKIQAQSALEEMISRQRRRDNPQ